jgi:hypothetical protein
MSISSEDKVLRKVKTVCEFKSPDDSALSFREGEIADVLEEDSGSGWTYVRMVLSKALGYVPATHIETYTSPPPPAASAPAPSPRSVAPTKPQPPPPPPSRALKPTRSAGVGGGAVAAVRATPPALPARSSVTIPRAPAAAATISSTRAKVYQDWTCETGEITLKAGDEVEVASKDDTEDGIWVISLPDGSLGYAPASVFKPPRPTPRPTITPPVDMRRLTKMARVMYDYCDKQVTLQKGEEIVVVSQESGNGWWLVRQKNCLAYAPHTYVQLCDAEGQ